MVKSNYKIEVIKLVHPFKSLWQFVVSGLIAGLVMVFFDLLISGVSFSLKFIVIATLWSFSIWITQWFGHAYLAHLITRKFPFEKYKWKTIVVRVITLVLYSLVAFLIVQYLLKRLFNGPLDAKDLNNIISVFPIVVGISFFVSLVLASIQFYKIWKDSVLEHEKMKAEMMTYKYDSLRNQINPHFLFNSLNVLTDLVIEDQNLAVKFIRQLSLLYRYVLESSQKELASIHEEMKFVESYQFLLQTRFEAGLKITLPDSFDANKWVVPLSLQLLIENAVKHNVVSVKKQLLVSIFIEDDYLIVSNNFQKKEIGDFSSGKGLQNIISRYAFFTDRPVIIEPTEDYYTVKLPLLEKS